jgi:transposase InsO family protein
VVTFLEAAVAYYARLGIRIERVMTDNGSCYRSRMFRATCKRLGLRQIFTRPYTPKTNGRPSASSKLPFANGHTLALYQNSDQRSAELVDWLCRYNWHRLHGSLKAKTPISRLGLAANNLLSLNS